MSDTPSIAFIGAGNMAGAIIEGVIAAGTYAPGQITAADVRPEATRALADAHGIHGTSDNASAVSTADVVVLSVKPQTFAQLLPAIAGSLRADALVISIAAGVPLSVIEAGLGAAVRVVRVMPNTPALVRAGATALSAGTHATDADLATAEAVFAAVGETVRVPEAQLDAVTGLSGSGPAYVFRLVEAMIAGGQSAGLGEAEARALAHQTVFGAAKLLVDSGEPAAALRARVTSPGGTTAAGLAALEAAGFEQAVVACVAAATDRSKQLGDEVREKLASSKDD